MVERRLWEADAVGSNPITPITTSIFMEFYSVEHWQEHWDALMERVENGETIGVTNDRGDRAVMTPADDELIRMYTDHSEAS